MPANAQHGFFGAAVIGTLLPLSAAQAQPPVLQVVPEPAVISATRTANLPPQASARVVTWPELVRHAKSDPPAVLVAHAVLMQARAQTSYARGQWLPSLTGQGSVGYSYDNRLIYPGLPRIDSQSIDSRANLAFDWAAFDLARGARIDQAREAENARGYDFQAAQKQALGVAAELYLRAGAASALIKDAELSLSRRTQQHHAIADLVEAGTRSPVDAQRANIEVLSAQYTLALRRTEEQAGFAALAAAIGLAPGSRVRPASDSMDSGAALFARTEVAPLAYEHRPELRAAQAHVRAFEAAHDAAVAERLPTFGASANGTVSYVDVRSGDGVGGHQYGGAAGVYLRWRGLDPAVWQKGDVTEADAQRAELERLALIQDIGRDAVNAYYALERARTELQSAVALLGAAEVTREAQNGRYLAGLASLLELLDAEDLEQQARQRRIESQRDEAIAQARLLSTLGLLDASAPGKASGIER